jgi:serine/threonine-protein kinase RsbW
MVMGSVVTLTVPAEPASVQMLRLVAAAEAARVDLPYDVIEESRIIVSEAAAALLEAAEGAGELVLRLTSSGGAMSFTLGCDAPADPGRIQRGWPWQIMAGLARGAEVRPTEEGVAIEIDIAGPRPVPDHR